MIYGNTYSAVSSDLYQWEVLGAEITDCSHEGPNVFEDAGIKWMITDCWDGLAVYKSDDFTNWSRYGENLLRIPGTRQDDTGMGNHAADGGLYAELVQNRSFKFGAIVIPLII